MTTGSRTRDRKSRAASSEVSEADAELVGALLDSINKLARAQRVARQREPAALPFGLTSVLGTLDRFGPLTATRLATLEGVRKPSMTRAIAVLVEKEMVVRIDDPTDGRQSMLLITAKGRAATADCFRRAQQWYLDLLDTLTPEERDRLQAAGPALRRLAAAARQ
jgi:DNA-binding MarR family transcriptional regulator